MGLSDGLFSAMDAAEKAAGSVCIFAGGPMHKEGKTVRMRLPLPKRIDSEGGHYELSYEGTFFSGYDWKVDDATHPQEQA